MPTYRQGRTYRHGKSEGGVCALLVIGALLVGVPVAVVVAEAAHRGRVVALEGMLSGGVEVLTPSTRDGAVVHVQSREISSMARDEAFGVRALGAVNLRRECEYCQWQEIRSEECERCSRTVTARDGSSSTETYRCNCRTRFSYLKGWRSHRIPSLLFDQAASHHNPQRDPYPSTSLPTEAHLRTTTGVEVVAGPAVLARTRARWRTLEWSLGGGGRTARTRRESPQALADARQTRAYRRDGFVYAGGGYFFSPHARTAAETLLKGFFQYLEGSLFDWQLGDLVPSCTPGDIRVRYQVQDPKRLSILATLRRAPGRLELVPDAIVHAGLREPDAMIALEAAESRKTVAVARAFLALWALAFAVLVGAALGIDVTTSLLAHGLAAAASLAAVLALVWAALWDPGPALALAVLVSVAAAAAVSHLAEPAQAPPGLNAVYCKLARWADAPPHWRVESSYRHAPYKEDPHADPAHTKRFQ